MDIARNPLNFKVDRSENSKKESGLNPMHPDFEETRKLREKVAELSLKVKELEKRV